MDIWIIIGCILTALGYEIKRRIRLHDKMDLQDRLLDKSKQANSITVDDLKPILELLQTMHVYNVMFNVFMFIVLVILTLAIVKLLYDFSKLISSLVDTKTKETVGVISNPLKDTPIADTKTKETTIACIGIISNPLEHTPIGDTLANILIMGTLVVLLFFMFSFCEQFNGSTNDPYNTKVRLLDPVTIAICCFLLGVKFGRTWSELALINVTCPECHAPLEVARFYNNETTSKGTSNPLEDTPIANILIMGTLVVLVFFMFSFYEQFNGSTKDPYNTKVRHLNIVTTLIGFGAFIGFSVAALLGIALTPTTRMDDNICPVCGVRLVCPNTPKGTSNPLEQFEVTPIVDTITNVLVIVSLIVLVLFVLKSFFNFRIVTVLDMIIQGIHNLVAALQRENLALVRQYFYMSILYIFNLILLSNLSGLAPFAFTLTSSFVVTFFLASAFFILINVLGTYNLQWDMFNLFLPSGTPLWIIPFLTIIELISYIARVFSLAIRLFANMMSGHALLKILIGFSFVMFTSASIIVILAGTVPWLIVNVIVVLEMLIAFLQAYVFVVLLTLYLSDILFSH